MIISFKQLLNEEPILNESSRSIEIGTKYIPVGKKYTCTVIDIWKTYNNSGKLVQTRYVSIHQFQGQIVTDHDVLETTIKRGFVS